MDAKNIKSATPRATTLTRNLAIKERASDLKKDRRLRGGYIVEVLAKEFFLSERRIYDILYST